MLLKKKMKIESMRRKNRAGITGWSFFFHFKLPGAVGISVRLQPRFCVSAEIIFPGIYYFQQLYNREI